METPNIMTLDELREAIGPTSAGTYLNKETLRAWLRSGNCPFGCMVATEEHNPARSKCLIFRRRFEAYINGMDMIGADKLLATIKVFLSDKEVAR